MRKVRSDKKIHVSPTAPIKTKELLYELAYLLDCPAKNLIEAIIIECIEDPQLMQKLSQYYKRDIRIYETSYFGSPQPTTIEKIEGETARLSTRLQSVTNEGLQSIAYAIGCSASKACLLMIETALNDSEFMEYVSSRFAGYERNQREVRRVLEGSKTVVEKVMDFVINRWDK
ncbi:hypothetical protein CSV71_15065 [Sporosarcina sp. P21c]|uniref:hypothetical protein n=1 Tax=Sporosarcina sp. P21c TaxID=2048255 RepID=UPI000C172028|nr:hypothetical protein [Sporosarcina sp. P21c]PIC88443.1 hypothetical protein CSV71_15065 [Sporosarcina sp. P21c]